MALRKLEKAEWRVFCDAVSKTLLGKRAEIEVESLAFGSQVEAEWLPVLGIVYDHKNDIVEIVLEDLDHIINKPRELFVDIGALGLMSVEIVDGDGVRQIVKFRDPLMLPAPYAVRQRDLAGDKRR